jgi:hypothetical protein
MKMKWFDCIGIVALIFFAMPSYAYAGGEGGDAIVIFLMIFLIMGVVFLMGREVVCWYWKINQRIALMTEIRDLLKNLPSNNFQQVTEEIKKNVVPGSTSYVPKQEEQTNFDKETALPDIEGMSSNELYSLAHNMHYSKKHYSNALKIYNEILSKFPDSEQAGYAKTQINNIQNMNKIIQTS